MPVLMALKLPSPPAAPAKCTLDAVKLGACVDLLSGVLHVNVGDPIANQAKLLNLNLNILVPVALQLIASCGMTPNFTCPAS
ncbi:hypothetical protein SUGI_0472750 [Cryptomeria japonica]|nr:hypothetical protein SUGI_0472750 [Cryptomeria japonica]